MTEKLDPKVWRIMGVVVLAPFMTQMDSTIVNVSLSTIQSDLHASIASAQWIVSGYLLALALMLPLNGWLVDRFGAKKLYLFCFSAFTLSSFLCGAAHTMPQLIGARVIQGMAGGLLAPLTQFMVARIAGKQMARVVGYAAAPILLAPLLGPPLAGAILRYASWPWLFYVNLPVGALAVVLAAFIIPHDKEMIRRRPFDIVGFLLLSPGLSLFLYGFERFTRHHGASLLVAGTLLLGVFIGWARQRKEKALIDIELFRNHTFTVATITQFLGNGILYSGQFLIPLYLTLGAGLTPVQAGWVLMSTGIGMMCVYPFMGNITDKFGCRAVVASGVLVNCLGTLPFMWMAYHGFSLMAAAAALFVRGLGQAVTGLPSLAAAYASVPREKLSFATTAVNIVQRLGGPLLTTAIAMVVALSTTGVSEKPSFGAPFLALIVFQILILGSAVRLPVRIHQGEAA